MDMRSRSEFMGVLFLSIEIVTGVAGELGVGPTEGGEVLEFINSLKADIVTAWLLIPV